MKVTSSEAVCMQKCRFHSSLLSINVSADGLRLRAYPGSFVTFPVLAATFQGSERHDFLGRRVLHSAWRAFFLVRSRFCLSLKRLYPACYSESSVSARWPFLVRRLYFIWIGVDFFLLNGNIAKPWLFLAIAYCRIFLARLQLVFGAAWRPLYLAWRRYYLA